MKSWLLVGAAIWVTYILLKNKEHSDRLSALEQDVSKLASDAAGTAQDVIKNGISNVKSFTIPPQYLNGNNNSVPSTVLSSFDTSKNATVSPAPVQVGTA